MIDQRSGLNTKETNNKLHTSTNSILVQDVIDQSLDEYPISTNSLSQSDCLNTQLPNFNTKNLPTSISVLEIADQTTCKSIVSNSPVTKSKCINIELACTNTAAVPKTATLQMDTDHSILGIPMLHNQHVIKSKETSKKDQVEEISAKDFKLLEQKLKRKEEQLKIKEAILNDNSNDKTRILERLFKAESRNLELEQSLKTLNRYSSVKNQNHNDVKTTDNHKQKQPAEDLIRGIHERVTEAPTSSVQHNVDYTNPHSQSYPYNTHYSRDNNVPITNFNDSHDPYYPYYHNWYNYQDNSHMNYYPETRTSDYNIHGNGWGNGGTYHNVLPETFHHSYNQHSAENQVCFSNLISLTLTQQSANSVSNTEVKCRKKTSTLRFHNPSTYSTGTTNQTSKEKESSKFYGNDSSIYTHDDKASPMFHVSRIGQPLYYSPDKPGQDFLYKELFQFERHKMMS
ncbi:unnamed protein product [Mytilus coruscus]|uniref:Uncharacterized protein n=1 Tax=Mytilus coruscus TaxID=42192 RepID=A0A6J8A5L7_MYTCO|nr:unnamed protein product [Mytilus coruscus]